MVVPLETGCDAAVLSMASTADVERCRTDSGHRCDTKRQGGSRTMSGDGADDGAGESDMMELLSSSSQLRLSSASCGHRRQCDATTRRRGREGARRVIDVARCEGSAADLCLEECGAACALDGEATFLHGGLADDAVLQDHLCERLVRVLLRGGCVSRGRGRRRRRDGQRTGLAGLS